MLIYARSDNDLVCRTFGVLRRTLFKTDLSQFVPKLPQNHINVIKFPLAISAAVIFRTI